MRKIGLNTAHECACETTIRHIGGAWKVLILWHLGTAKLRRHAELKRLLRGVTAKMLTQQLREMEQDGLVGRTIHAEVPPRVEYQLTPLGKTLRPVIDAMYSWGKQRGVSSQYSVEAKKSAGNVGLLS
jgi:DNA-binding HxlR family transcriptional regulator